MSTATNEPSFKRHHGIVAGREASWLEGGQGRTLILLHGAAFDHADLTWRDAARILARTHRVLIPDLPGYGQTEAIGKYSDLGDLGEWVVQWMMHIGLPRSDIAGISMGGGIALWLGVNHAVRVRSLVAVAPYGLMRRAPMHLLGMIWRYRPLSTLFYQIALRFTRRAMAAFAVSDGTCLTEMHLSAMRNAARDQIKRRSFDGFLDAEMSVSGLRNVVRDDMPALCMPVLFIHSPRDPVIPIRDVREVVPEMKAAKLVELDGKHLPHLEFPGRVASEINSFLEHATLTKSTPSGTSDETHLEDVGT